MIQTNGMRTKANGVVCKWADREMGGNKKKKKRMEQGDGCQRRCLQVRWKSSQWRHKMNWWITQPNTAPSVFFLPFHHATTDGKSTFTRATSPSLSIFVILPAITIFIIVKKIISNWFRRRKSPLKGMIRQTAWYRTKKALQIFHSELCRCRIPTDPSSEQDKNIKAMEEQRWLILKPELHIKERCRCQLPLLKLSWRWVIILTVSPAVGSPALSLVDTVNQQHLCWDWMCNNVQE